MPNNQLFKKNKLICGDNLDELAKLEKESIDLIYIDPPFFSNRQYEVIWGDEAEVRSFQDRWSGGIEHYIAWMRPRIEELYRVLKLTGSMYLHCDWHANHRLRILMDRIFGENNFKNEIIWSYKRWTAVSNRFQRLHDTILFYTKNECSVFNTLLIPYADKEAHYTEKDEKGEFRWQYLGGKKYKLYKKEGVRLGDVWEIPYLNSMAAERLGYPTQKPETLLERIIQISSNKGDVVLDAFCGCGTALAIAQKLGRQWIGIDISPTAIKLVERRLQKIGAIKGVNYTAVGIPTTTDDLKKLQHFEFQNWIIDEMRANHTRRKVGDMGLDGYYRETIFTQPAGIQVKQSEGIGRNVIDNFETALRREKYKKGYIIAFSFGKGAHEEVARIKDDLDIRLVKVEDLLTKEFKV